MIMVSSDIVAEKESNAQSCPEWKVGMAIGERNSVMVWNDGGDYVVQP